MKQKNSLFSFLTMVTLFLVIFFVAYNQIFIDYIPVSNSPDKDDYSKWVNEQFSAYDGSSYWLIKYVKQSMNDPDSFQHIETRYTDNGDKTLTVTMKYRGNNAFGGKVVNYANAIFDYKNNKITK